MSIQDMEDLKKQYLDEMKTLINGKDYRNGKIDIEIKINELKENFKGMSIKINKKKQLQQLEQVANLNTYPSRHFNSFCYDNDDDDDEEYTIAITPDLPTEEPGNSLSMGDEHLDTIPEMELNELIKSSDENLVPIPSESEDFSDIESKCDVSDCDDSQTTNFSTFSNPLFDNSTSSDDESSHEEFNPIHNEDLDSTPKNDRFNTESYLRESLLNQHEEYISMMERLLYDNSSPRPPKDFHANPNTIIESLPIFPIPVEDSDSFREEIDIFPGLDDSIPPGIESDDYESEGDDNSTSSDDESSHEEVIKEISFKTYSNPLFDLDEEIISSEFNPIHNEDLDSTLKNDRFDTESYLLESLLNRDTLIASSPKIDSLLDEFADFNANPNTIIESLPTFPIPVEDSNSLREDIDIFPGPDDSIPPDSTIDVVEDIPVDVPNILPTHTTIHMDFNFIPSHNDLGSNLDVSSPFGDRNKIYDPGICIEVESKKFLATLSLVIDTLLPFSSENKDKVFNHSVLASKEKSPPSSSH
ncbi:hypothetical protein Tco_1359924 [Tanacetum coccineum]